MDTPHAKNYGESGMREGLWDHLGGHRTTLATEVSCDGNILDEADIPGATP